MWVPLRFPCRNVRGIPYTAKCRRRSVITGLESKMSERSDKPIVFPAPLNEETQTSGGPERRVQVRYPFTAAAEVHELRSQTRVTGRCSDLSPGGCYVDTLSPFAVGSAVRVRIERELREFEAAAIVSYAHVSMGMGLSFTAIKREHQDVLRSWIADLSGEQPSEPVVSTTERETGAIEENANMRFVMNELITLLVRKKIITENEGSGLLRQMFR
jgi:PilZ domain